MDESVQTGPNGAQPDWGTQPGWAPPGQPLDEQRQQHWLPPGQPQYQQWPPQYGPAGPGYYPPQPMRQPKGRLAPVRSMGMVVQVLLCVVFVVGVVQLIAAFGRLSLLQRLADDLGSVGQVEADQSDRFTQNVGIVWLLCYLLTAVFVVMWFHRVRTNAGIWAPAVQRRSRGWAIWGWICPVVNLWFPYQIAVDALRSSRPYGSNDTSGGGVLGVWWGLWVFGLFLALSVRGQRQADTLDAITNAVRTDLVADVVILAAAVAAVLVVRKLTALQEAKLAEPVAPAPGGMISGWA